jgi:hypothetical protein
MSQGDDAERRLYERIPGGGTQATLRISGRPGVQARILDISRGGMGLAHECADKMGAEVEAALPGGVTVKGRIARKLNGSIGLVFQQDKTSLAQIDLALALIRENTSQEAA